MEVKTERMDSIMLLQQDISLQKNKQLIGNKERVLIDLHTDENISIGRTYRDAPEVDNSVRVEGKLPIGEFVDVEITGASEYDVTGKVLNYG